MNKIFRKLTVRNIKSNFKQFISIIVIVLLATMLLSGFIVNSSTFDSSINRYFEEANLADMWLYVDKIDENDEKFLSENNIDYAKRFYSETTAKIPAINLQNNVKLYVGSGKDAKISKPLKESGKFGCMIDKNVAENNNIHSGTDTIAFTLNFPVGTENITLNFEERITGTMSFDECADTYSSWPIFIEEDKFLDMLNSALTNAGYGSLIQLENMDRLYNQILIKTDNFDETSKLVKGYYANETTLSNLVYVLSRDSIESVVLLKSEINQSKKMIYVFPVIFLIVSILIILTSIDQLVIQEKSKIGTLKSIGIPDKKILWHYVSYGTVLCAIGAVLGIILGTLIIPEIMFVKYNLVYSIPENLIKLNVPIWILLAVLFGMILIGFLVSLFACYGILHKKPIECLRFDISSGGKSLKNSKGKLKKLPLSIKMAMRNTKLKPVRTLMASIGIAGCVALLLCGIGIGDTLRYSTSNDLDNVFKYDITTTYANANFETELNSIDGIEFSEKYEQYYAEVSFGGKLKNKDVYIISEKSKLSKIYLSGNEVCISKSLASEFGIKIGDKLSVSVGGNKKELVVSKFIETAFFNGIFVCGDLGFSNATATHGMWIKCNSNPSELTKKINQINGTNTAYSKADLRDNVENKISSINVMTTTLETFAIMLAIVVLLNLIFLILKERTREIATLKVLGRSDFSIGLAMFFEMTIMAIFGTVAGLLLGYPLLVLVLSINKVEVMNFLYHINISSYIIAIAIIFVTIVCVSLFCLIKVRKINMIESLKSVE